MTDIKFTEEWLQKAKDDYLVAKHVYEDMSPKQLSISAYHCQQAAEKALKGYLVYCDIEPPRTHDLDELLKLCIAQDKTFEEYTNDCLDLSEYITHTRYPDSLELLESDVLSAITKAQRIYDFVYGLIPNLDKALHITTDNKREGNDD